MTEFGVSALLEAEPVGLREARAEIEEELGGEIEIEISGTRTTDLLGGGAGASSIADGGAELVDVATEQRDILEDILDELEQSGGGGALIGAGNGSVGGSGGGLLSLLAGRGSAGIASGILGTLGRVGLNLGTRTGGGAGTGFIPAELFGAGLSQTEQVTGTETPNEFTPPPSILSAAGRDARLDPLVDLLTLPQETSTTVGVNDPTRRGITSDRGGRSLVLSDRAERLLSEGVPFSSSAEQTVQEAQSAVEGATGQIPTDQPGGGGGGVGVFDETRSGISPGAPPASESGVGVFDETRAGIGGPIPPGEQASTRDIAQSYPSADLPTDQAPARNIGQSFGSDGEAAEANATNRIEATVRNRIETNLQLDDRQFQEFLRDPERYIERVVERAFRGR